MKNIEAVGVAIVLALLTSCASQPSAPQPTTTSLPPQNTADQTPLPSPQAIDAAIHKQEPQRTLATTLTSPDDINRITSQIADLIAPFTIEEVRNGLKNEQALWSQSKGVLATSGGQQKGDFVVNTDADPTETLTMTKVRQSGGKVSVEVGLRGGNIEEIQFKILPDGAGFQAIWNAKPVVVLSKRIPSMTLDGETVAIETLLRSQVRPIKKHEIAHARELASA